MIRRLLGLAPLLALGACSAWRASDRVPGTARVLPASWVATEGIADAPQPWLADFADPQLRELVAEAWAYNHDLQAAAARVLAAQARAGQARAPRLPTLDLNASAARSRSVQDLGPFGLNVFHRSDFQVGLGLQWELDLWGRLAAGSRAAAAESRAAFEDLRGARLSLGVRTCQALFAIREARAQAALADRARQVRARLSSVLEGRLRDGLGSAKDLATARQAEAVAAAEVPRWRDQEQRAQRELEVLLGRYPAAQVAAVADLPPLPPPVPAGVPAGLLLRRADLRAAFERLLAGDERLAAARADLLPRLALTASSGRRSDELADLGDGDFSVWNLVLNLVAPLFDGGRRRAVVAEQEARLRELVASYEATLLRALAEVENALAGEELLRQRAVEQQRAVDAGAQVVAAEEADWAQGLGSTLALLEARQRWLQASSTQLALRRLLLDNRLQLLLALGGEATPGEEP